MSHTLHFLSCILPSFSFFIPLHSITTQTCQTWNRSVHEAKHLALTRKSLLKTTDIHPLKSLRWHTRAQSSSFQTSLYLWRAPPPPFTLLETSKVIITPCSIIITVILEIRMFPHGKIKFTEHELVRIHLNCGVSVKSGFECNQITEYFTGRVFRRLLEVRFRVKLL